MSKAVIFFAPGLEECEGLLCVDILRRAGVEVTIAAVGGNQTVTSARQVHVVADALAEDVDYSAYDACILPGGIPGVNNLKADATICGTAINTFASGFTVLLLFTITGEKGTSASLKSFSFPTVNIPLIEDIPVIGKILSGHNLMTYVALLAVLVVWFLLYKMPLGLRIRSVGENPDAASSVGVNVRRTRYIAILLCGALTGLGGMYMSMGYLGMFTREMVAGRGFIALAAAAMGQSTPIGVFLSSMLFAFFDGMSNTLQLLALPSQFIDMLPYLATIGGLTAYSIQRARKAKRRLAV